jgi:hypothetical protein
MAYTTINKGSDYFNTVIYTGTSAENAITGVNFQPDFTWIKGRSNAYDHRLVDSVRGATKELYSDLSNAEATDAQGLKSFNSDGFTLGTANAVNNSGATFVAWNWLAANGTASNTNGSITSTVSANTTSGFSVVTWVGTGANGSVGHGLGATPACFILKDRDDAYDWRVYHQSTGNTGAMILNSTTSFVTDSSYYNNTSPDSSKFYLGNNAGNNGSGRDYVAYCFAEKKGFSKFGSYTGNGSTDGPFVYTGFKPAFVITKGTDSADNWGLLDNKRDGYNLTNKALTPNSSGAEYTTNSPASDFVSNGFKIRQSDGVINASGGSYIYLAFAENPFVGSDGTPTTAR